MDNRYDVVIAGAGIAGCTAATMYARAGLSVLLLEAHRSATTFKRLCTHLVQASAVPTLRRLGLDRQIEERGGIRTAVEIHTRFGWVRASDFGVTEYGYNLRRSELDPLLRSVAAATPGVDVVYGARVTSLRRDGDTVTGLGYRDEHGEPREVRATLVVGADGRHSTVAKLAGVPFVERPHGRVALFAHFATETAQGATTAPGAPAEPVSSRLWLRDPDIAYAFPNDQGRLVVAAMMPPQARLKDRAMHEQQLRETIASLPDGPDLDGARRVSDVMSVLNYVSVRRRPTAPGLALVGDAASVTDYLWGAGCGWAFQSAEWLVDATADALSRRRGLGLALARYTWRRRRELTLHLMANDNYATGRSFSGVERTVLHAATIDPYVGRRIFGFGARTMAPTRVFTPALLARSQFVVTRARRRAAVSGGAPDGAVAAAAGRSGR